MDVRNLLTITGSNLQLNRKQTLFPAIVLLPVIPLICGTSGLDSVKSADLLERMVALIGLPMFVPLLRPEQEAHMDADLALRPFPYQMIALLRVMLSLMGTCMLILAFEGYMVISGCRFPVCAYAVRTLAAAMTLGFIGLLASAASKSTIVGFLAAFCWYLALQTEHIGTAFKCVSKGISVYQTLLLLGSGAAILFLSRLPFQRKARSFSTAI